MTAKSKKADESALALFQEQLLRLLDEGKTPEEVRRALLAEARLAPFHAYIEGMEDNMLEIAAELVAKWGVPGKPA